MEEHVSVFFPPLLSVCFLSWHWASFIWIFNTSLFHYSLFQTFTHTLSFNFSFSSLNRAFTFFNWFTLTEPCLWNLVKHTQSNTNWKLSCPKITFIIFIHGESLSGPLTSLCLLSKVCCSTYQYPQDLNLFLHVLIETKDLNPWQFVFGGPYNCSGQRLLLVLGSVIQSVAGVWTYRGSGIAWTREMVGCAGRV